MKPGTGYELFVKDVKMLLIQNMEWQTILSFKKCHNLEHKRFRAASYQFDENRNSKSYICHYVVRY